MSHVELPGVTEKLEKKKQGRQEVTANSVQTQ